LIATAIHSGHELRSEVNEIIALTDAERLREEDPFTDLWTPITDTTIVGLQSRFEVDLNRPREKAVYLKPEDAWGLHVWKTDPSAELVKRSLAEYDAFYSEIHHILTEMLQKYDHLVLFDLHTYNHRREGPKGLPADPELNPEVNIGTGSLNREYWAPVLDRFITDLCSYNFLSRRLDVRENIKFKGGNFSRWIHQTFPNKVCVLSIEFKKFFMDEWTGNPDKKQVNEIQQALASTIPGILAELNNRRLSG
jgi:N-formylglutamate deformylase